MSITPVHHSGHKRKEPDDNNSTSSNYTPMKSTLSPATESPCTPYQRSTTYNPGTPGIKKQGPLSKSPFKKRVQQWDANSFPYLEIPKDINASRIYQCNGDHTLIQQRSTKDCGAAALLMLITDVLRKDHSPLPIDQKFWDWFNDCSGADSKVLMRTARKKAGIRLEKHQVPSEDPLNYLKKLLEETGHPLITSISHPTLKGHWIVVDAITHKKTHIRDPKTGDAYAIPNKTMKSYFTNQINENSKGIENTLCFRGRIGPGEADSIDSQ